MERFMGITSYSTVECWRDRIFEIAKELGYSNTLLAIFPDRTAPIEAEFAFLHSNYSAHWRDKYDDEKMGHVDPTVSHCATKSTPLIWTPDIFLARKQKEMYEEACGHGLRSGVTLPIHGSNGELGVLCFVADMKPDKNFTSEAIRNMPTLSLFRDFIFETSLQFMSPSSQPETIVVLTPRELECIKWCAAGKSSWDIGELLNCSAATVNFHFSNIRHKFGTSTRREALVKAIRIGLVNHV